MSAGRGLPYRWWKREGFWAGLISTLSVAVWGGLMTYVIFSWWGLI